MFINTKEIERLGGRERNADIHTALRILELNGLIISDVTDGMVNRALQAFDTGTGDPNDYHARMRGALEATISPINLKATSK